MRKVNEKIKKLRAEMKKESLDAYLITGTDPHQSEYVAPRWRTREFISGFTGSAGTVVITKNKAILWVDSRYFIQAANQINGTEFEMIKLDVDDNPDPYRYLEENMPEKAVVGVDAASISIEKFKELSESLKKRCIVLKPTEDILDRAWTGRPAIPFSKCVQMKDEYAGFTASAKVNFVRYKLQQKKADWTFIASIDDIAWLTNLRADDIAYNPVFVSFAFISKERAVLFTNPKRFTKTLLKKVEENFELFDYTEVLDKLPELTKNGIGYYSPEKVSACFIEYVDKPGSITGRDITTDLKARKNPAELEGMRRAHFLDGVAFANFMAKVDPLGKYSEIEISKRFEEEREKMEGYLGPSFAPISGFKENGAMCHYSATEESNREVSGQGLLVLDTGSQFEFGMTDLTRTLLFGSSASEEEKRDYTLVLKGHLALARQRFPQGTKGVQLDVLARQYLWTAGMTFYHGTGHGVGCRLNVHEGPERISTALIDVPLEPGMVVSDEPGVYKEGRHGIRIENLVAVQEDVETEFGKFYSFEVLSMVPYEKKLIDTRYLTESEIQQINAYHKWVHDQLIDYVFDEAKPWLENATSPIEKI